MKKFLPFIKIALILFIPIFFYLNPFLPWPKDLIFEAAGHGNGVLAFFEARETGIPAPLFFGHTSYILGQYTLMLVYALGGATTFTTILNTSILGFLTVLATAFFAKKFLGFWGGIVTLLFFSGSLFFLMVIRTAYPFYGTIPLTVALALFFFTLAHQSKQKNYLFLAGIALGFVGLAGGHGIPLTIVILIGFLGWKIIFREKLFPIKDYLLFSFLTLLVFLGFQALFPLINNNQPFEYLHGLYRLLTQRGGQVAMKGTFSFRYANTLRLFKAFFIDMNVPRQGHQHFLTGRAMLPPFASLFFLWGIVVSFIKRKDIDKMLLLWVGGVFFFYGWVADFQVRYFLMVAPAIYFLTAKGAIDLWKRVNQPIFLIILTLMITSHLFITFQDYYVVLANQAFKLEMYEGQAEMASYIKENYEPEDVFLVMSNVVGVPPPNFIFYTWEKRYDFHYWNFFLEKGAIPYSPVEQDLVTGERLSSEEESWFQKFSQWQEEKLKKYKKIIYVFAFYSNDLTQTKEWVRFREVYPHLLPKKTIFAHNKQPQMGIYEVTPETLKTTKRQLELYPNQRRTFNTPFSGKLKAIVFSGATESPRFYLNDSIIDLPMTTYPSEKTVIVFGGKSYFVFSPSFASGDIEDDLYRIENIVHSPIGSGVAGQEGRRGELVYRLVAPKPIEKLDIVFFPVIFNDKQKSVFLNLSYSLDDQTYETIHHLKSDGSGGWVGDWQTQTRLTIYPQSQAVYLRFLLTGSGARLSSTLTSTMSFEGEFEGETLNLNVKSGENSFWFTGGEETLSTLYFTP